LIKNDDAAARASGWRIVAYCRSSLPDERYEAGLADDDETVLPAVRQAAAWNAAPAFFSLCRLVAAAPSADSLETLVTIAAIAPPTDYKAIEAIAASPAVGPDRFRVVGAFGHPYFIDHLIREIERTDSDAVPSAFAAFTKMTGETVKTADEARRAWRALAPQLAHAARICAGMDISGAVERSAFRRLDRESAWEFCLRARLTTGWPGTPATLEHFPQRG
jgi:hypothetical protein